ncbi:hypothetical protein F5984_23630 [Rudanella paleaurantiibacter]|uniref:Uncharacterized protein n=1 Tax=Rudanella paleaurantiibacter TaxID=2614655 RepID=A0A7J5TTF1_9BACT|nr:DUF6577 family protein [Rudanella paleaurantiibacter]KAB7726621.1 hypothetical protein F5984_23630 [Rudanella paleaurantiibacter]
MLVALQQAYPNAATSTLDWYIHTLHETGQLIRRGRGRYEVAGQSQAQKRFVPSLPNELTRLGKSLGEQFPLLTTCLWSTAAVHSFTVQQPFVTYWLVETERDAVDTVLDAILRRQRGGTLQKAPTLRTEDIRLAQRYNTDSSVCLLVKPLISEAPLQQDSNGLIVPTAEKILVDLVADRKIFDLFAEELPNMYTEFNSRFALNLDRLRRYARRRHQLPNIENYLQPFFNLQSTQSA